MRINLKHNLSYTPTRLRGLIAIILLLGVFFRFFNLEQGVYWRDETYTSLRISGYTQAELVRQVFDGNVIGVEDLQKYQRLNTKKDLNDMLKSLAVEDAQHPPLYYVMARLWVQWFGSSVAVTRSLSALISLLAFPCIYWLCLELFESPLVGWVAIALIAVSPFHIRYAQSAREYSLWTVTTLLSSAALLRGVRLKTKVSWGIYAVTVGLSLYTFPFSIFFLIGHGIYVFAIESFRFSKTLIAYLVAVTAGFSAFIPWLLIIIKDLQQISTTTSWLADNNSSMSWGDSWFINLWKLFIYNYNSGWPIVIIVGYLIYFIVIKAPKRICLFILILMGTSLPLILPDLIIGGRRSTIVRYLLPCYLSIHLAVAYLLTTKITYSSGNNWSKKIWQIIMIAIISMGAISCGKSYQESGWHRGDYQNLSIARIVNHCNNPLVVGEAHTNKSDGSIGTDGSIGGILSLSYLLDPRVKLQLVVQPHIPKIPAGFSDVFLFCTSKELQDGIKQKYEIEPIETDSEKFCAQPLSRVFAHSDQHPLQY